MFLLLISTDKTSKNLIVNSLRNKTLGSIATKQNQLSSHFCSTTEIRLYKQVPVIILKFHFILPNSNLTHGNVAERPCEQGFLMSRDAPSPLKVGQVNPPTSSVGRLNLGGPLPSPLGGEQL